MALRFKFRKERIVTDANFFLFHEFEAIWKWDKTSHRVKSNKMFYFIFLLCDLSEDNPLRDVHAEKKEEESLFRAYGDKKHKFTPKERSLVSDAVDCYIKYTKTAEERILEAFDNKAEELRDVLDGTLPETVENEKDGVTTFVSNTEIITNGLKEIDSIKRLKINVIAAVRKEAMMQRVRGQVVLSPLSKGDISITPDYEVYAQYEAEFIQGESGSGQELTPEGTIKEVTE